ncbi:MAG: HDOD domain-containing protein, partial [Candidatus Methylacidiphilales bacterium]
LRHTNIVPLYYVGQQGLTNYFAMAFIEGLTLDQYVAANGWLDGARAHWFMKQAVSALEYAARFGIIHLDIKPGNFIVDPDDIIMLTDFGLARRRREGEEEEDQELLGTPLYASPEHVTQGRPDIRTDMYCLGATLFHMMVGRPPYEYEELEAIARAHLEEPFPTQKAIDYNISTGWISLMRRLMEKDPAARFQTHAEIHEVLEKVEDYRYGPGLICVPPTHRKRGLPRGTGTTPETLFGILPYGVEVEIGEIRFSEMARHNDVEDLIKNRCNYLKIQLLLTDIKELCTPAESHNLVELVTLMDQEPVFNATISEIAGFMAKQMRQRVTEERMKLEIIGMGRASNLALTVTMLKNQWQNQQQPLNWNGLWQHQIYTGLLMEMMYEMLEIPMSGMEYVAGLLHDIGKLVLAELFPSLYPRIILQSMRTDTDLCEVEREVLGMDHAEAGFLWLRQNRASRNLFRVVGSHEYPSEPISAGLSLLSTTGSIFGGGGPKLDVEIASHAAYSASHLAKQLGLGFTGNTVMEQQEWGMLHSTQFLWNSRVNQDVAWEDFISFFTKDCEDLPDLSVAGLAMAPEGE